ncbi:MAG: hypothetical protein QXR48_03215 [Candidatus Woesearchaeota archaeon]
MSLDVIAMMSAPRKQLHKQNDTTSPVRNHYEDDRLYFANRCVEPANNVEGLYAKAFKEVVDSLPKETIRITQTHFPFDLYLHAKNRTTGKSAVLHAKTLEKCPYFARVYVLQDGRAEYLNWLTANERNGLMGQYRELKSHLTNHLK